MMFMPSSGRRGRNSWIQRPLFFLSQEEADEKKKDLKEKRKRDLKEEKKKEETDVFNRATMLQILKRENELRLSKKWIELMEKEANTMDSPINGYSYSINSPIILELQTQVMKEFGMKTDEQIKKGLNCLHSVWAKYGTDKEIINSANYLKFNRAQKGNIKIGDKFTDVQLANITGQKIFKFSEILTENINKFKHSVNFITVYIAEAHAQDEWPIRTKPELSIKQHRTLKDRVKAANYWVNELKHNCGPVYIDLMANMFMNTYSAWPKKIFIIHHGLIQWVLEPDKPGLFRFEDIEEAIESMIKNKTCNKGHPLTWTTSETLIEHDKNYAYGYGCDDCKREFDFDKNNIDKYASYHCAECCFDLCQNCYVNKESNCPGKHGLNKYKTPEDEWGCDVCQTEMSKGTVLYGCRTCDFDVCNSCLKTKCDK